MNKKTLILWITVFITIGKCGVLLMHGNILSASGWLFAGLWFIWIGYAFYADKDLPMVGSFAYGKGENQTGRFFAAIVMTGVFLIAALLG